MSLSSFCYLSETQTVPRSLSLNHWCHKCMQSSPKRRLLKVTTLPHHLLTYTSSSSTDSYCLGHTLYLFAHKKNSLHLLPPPHFDQVRRVSPTSFTNWTPHAAWQAGGWLQLSWALGSLRFSPPLPFQSGPERTARLSETLHQTASKRQSARCWANG